MSIGVQDRTTLGDTEITEAVILQLRDADELDAADVYDARLERLERIYKTSFVERGLILCEVEDRRLWNKITDPDTGTYFTSFERWVVTRCPTSRSDAFAAKGAIRCLKDVPLADLREMPRFAISTMCVLSPAVRGKRAMIEDLKTLPEKELRAKIARDYPEQHMEALYERRMRWPESARDLLTEGMEAAMWCYDVRTWEEATECLVAFFMEGKCEREGFTDQTNAAAYARRTEDPCQS